MHWMLAALDPHVAGECLAVISYTDLDCSPCEIPETKEVPTKLIYL